MPKKYRWQPRRAIVNISLPENLRKEVDEIVLREKYASRSEFFRELIRFWKNKQQ